MTTSNPIDPKIKAPILEQLNRTIVSWMGRPQRVFDAEPLRMLVVLVEDEAWLDIATNKEINYYRQWWPKALTDIVCDAVAAITPEKGVR